MSQMIGKKYFIREYVLIEDRTTKEAIALFVFRETYDDLEANLIDEWKRKVPKELYGTAKPSMSLPLSTVRQCDSATLTI